MGTLKENMTKSKNKHKYDMPLIWQFLHMMCTATWSEPKLMPTSIVNTCKTLQMVFCWFMIIHKNLKELSLKKAKFEALGLCEVNLSSLRTYLGKVW